jgi:ATP synthase protein I
LPVKDRLDPAPRSGYTKIIVKSGYSRRTLERRKAVGLAKFFNINDRNYIDNLSLAGSIGLHMVSSIFVGVAIGYGLDYWLDIYPWCSGIFMLLGIVAGFKNVYDDTRKLVARWRSETEEKIGKKK